MTATDCNSMRRDMTSSLRACLAAESWKRLWPDENRGGNTKAKGQKYTFEAFAKNSFKVSEAYAKQALAILNHSPELLEDAKEGHFDFRARVAIAWQCQRESLAQLTLGATDSKSAAKIGRITMKSPAKKSTCWMRRSPSGFATAGSLSHPSHRHRDTSAESGRHPLSHHWACSSSGHRSGPRWMPDSSGGRAGTLPGGNRKYMMDFATMDGRRSPSRAVPSDGSLTRRLRCDVATARTRGKTGEIWHPTTPLWEPYAVNLSMSGMRRAGSTHRIPENLHFHSHE